MPAGRPPKYDVVQFLREHPEHLESTQPQIARAMGVCTHTVYEQLMRARAFGKIRAVVVYRWPEDLKRQGKRKSIAEVRPERVARDKAKEAARQRTMRAENPERVRAYQRAYMMQWKKNKKKNKK